MVRVDVNRPLRRGIRIFPDGPLIGMWISIRYERLPEFCSCCGIIGHISQDCARFYRSERGFNSPPQYEVWLRFFGKGMLMAHLSVKENVGVFYQNNSQPQHYAIDNPVVMETDIATGLAPRRTQTEIRIVE